MNISTNPNFIKKLFIYFAWLGLHIHNPHIKAVIVRVWPGKYETFYATSDNYWKIWSIEKAKKLLNYHPKDSAPKQFVKREIRDADK